MPTTVAGESNICGVVEWGVAPYGRAYAWQKELVARRKAGEIPDLLVLCTHPHVITLGRNARRESLRRPGARLAARGLEVHPTDRGGDATYHGPGQLIGYPILDLSEHRKDVVWYVRALEEVLIRAADEFGIAAARKPAPAAKRQLYTGVWVGEDKLAAIGVHLSRWVTSHGFAFNVTTDLSYFDLIVPCGLADKGVTSLKQLLEQDEKQVPRFARDDNAIMEEARAAVGKHFGAVFGRAMQPVDAEAWEAWVGAHEVTAS